MPPKFQEYLDKAISTVLTGLKLGGLWGWVAKKVMEYGGQALYKWGKKAIDLFKRKKSQEKATEKLEEVKKNPDATEAEEIAATDDWLNK